MATLVSAVPASKPFNIHKLPEIAAKAANLIEHPPCLECTAGELCDRHTFHDERLGKLRPLGKKNVICWSLSTAKDFHGELPAPSKAQKELVTAEACLWKKREEEAGKWERFRA